MAQMLPAKPGDLTDQLESLIKYTSDCLGNVTKEAIREADYRIERTPVATFINA